MSCWVRPRWGRSPPWSGASKRWATRSASRSHQITHVFGPSGIGRVFTLLFTDAKRGTQDPTSVVGIGQAVGQTGSAGDWGAVLYFLAFVTVFIGLVNLVPLPPFDGGHLAVLLLEKIRGKTDGHAEADPCFSRRDVVLHRVRPRDDPPRHHEAHQFLAVGRERAPRRRHKFSTPRPESRNTLRIRWADDRETVLVVDDEVAIAEAVRARLESEGFRRPRRVRRAPGDRPRIASITPTWWSST